EGRVGFSLRKLASEVGRTTASIYTHFDSAEQVLDAVAARYLDTTELPAPSGDPLTDVETFAVADFRRALEHPELASLVVERRPVTPAARHAADYLENRLRKAGVDPEMVKTTKSTLGLHTMGAFAMRLGETTSTPLDQFHQNVQLILRGFQTG
ncbi:MAG: TetR/AcrR family transcriptional regulator, partial [Acidimicrobiia bacterium]